MSEWRRSQGAGGSEWSEESDRGLRHGGRVGNVGRRDKGTAVAQHSPSLPPTTRLCRRSPSSPEPQATPFGTVVHHSLPFARRTGALRGEDRGGKGAYTGSD